MHKFMIREAYGAWVAEDAFGNTIWALTREELLRSLGGGTPC